MLAQAAWKDTKFNVSGEIIDVPRGSFCASQSTIGKETLMTRKSLRTFINMLEKEKMIRTAPGTTAAKSTAMITICNYDKYQDIGPKKGQAGAKQGPTKEQVNHLTSSSIEEHKAIPEHQIAIEAWNGIASSHGWPKVQKITNPRISAISARLKDCGGVDGWHTALVRAGNSNFLTGRTSRPFFASFDWLTKPANFTKLMEGNYDNRTSQASPASNGGRSGPHDSLMDGFAAFANSEPDASGRDFGGYSPAEDPGDTSMDSGQGGYTSEPVLRLVNPR